MTIQAAPAIRRLDPNDLYRASARSPELVEVPELAFAMIDGQGDPNTSTEYREAIGAHYGLGYTLTFGCADRPARTSRVVADLDPARASRPPTRSAVAQS